MKKDSYILNVIMRDLEEKILPEELDKEEFERRIKLESELKAQIVSIKQEAKDRWFPIQREVDKIQPHNLVQQVEHNKNRNRVIRESIEWLETLRVDQLFPLDDNPKADSITSHSVIRFLQRSGEEPSKWIIGYLNDLLMDTMEVAVRDDSKVKQLLNHDMADAKYYFNVKTGFIFVVVDGIVKTVHRNESKRLNETIGYK